MNSILKILKITSILDANQVIDHWTESVLHAILAFDNFIVNLIDCLCEMGPDAILLILYLILKVSQLIRQLLDVPFVTPIAGSQLFQSTSRFQILAH